MNEITQRACTRYLQYASEKPWKRFRGKLAEAHGRIEKPRIHAVALYNTVRHVVDEAWGLRIQMETPFSIRLCLF